MNPDQIPQLLKQVSYADPRLLPDDPAEVMGMAALWATVLADVPADYALQAVGQHYAQSPYPIKPSDIADRWRTTVRDRMRQHTGTFEPNDHPEIDPDDIPGYQEALRSDLADVAAGRRPPTPSRAITSGEIQRDDVRAMRQQNDLMQYMRDSVRQAQADNAARQALVRRYPDLWEAMTSLPGQAKWNGYIARGNKRAVAIYEEAQRRRADADQAAQDAA